MNIEYAGNSALENKDTKEKKDGVLAQLKQYGLDRVKSLFGQKEKINNQTQSLFSSSLGLFKKMLSPGVNNLLRSSKDELEQTDDEIGGIETFGRTGQDEKKEPAEKLLVNGIKVYGELDLYKKLDFLLDKLTKNESLQKKDVFNKIAVQTKGTSFVDNELTNGKIISNDVQRQAINLVDNFKKETVKYLIGDTFNMSLEDAKGFLDYAFECIENLDSCPSFSLVEYENEKGKKELKLNSNNFIERASHYAQGIEKHSKHSDSDVESGQYLNITDKEQLPSERKTLAEDISRALELSSEGRVDQADWYEVGNLSANKVLRILEQIKNQRKLNNGGLSNKTAKWIEDSLNIFKPAQDETFAEYIERRFMKGGRLPTTYNDIVRVVKVFNEKEGKININRQMIGEMPVREVFKILKTHKKIGENIGIKSILNHEVRPSPNESLRRYFYRLTASYRGFLNKDGSVNEKGMQGSDDFREIIILLEDIIPKVQRRRLLKESDSREIPYYKRVNVPKDEEHIRPTKTLHSRAKETPYYERVNPQKGT